MTTVSIGQAALNVLDAEMYYTDGVALRANNVAALAAAQSQQQAVYEYMIAQTNLNRSFVLNSQGAWNNTTVYNPNDLVTSGGLQYLCILTTTAGQFQPPNVTYWVQMG